MRSLGCEDFKVLIPNVVCCDDCHSSGKLIPVPGAPEDLLRRIRVCCRVIDALPEDFDWNLLRLPSRAN